MPTVTKNLIIINVLVFFGTLVAQRYGIDLTNYLGLHFFLASDFNPAQPDDWKTFRWAPAKNADIVKPDGN